MTDSDQILVALRRITRAIDLYSKRLERRAGLTVPQLLILKSVARESDLPVSTLARRVSLSQGTVTSVLDRLEQRGYVARTRGTTDRRVVGISLTGAGREILARAPGMLQADFVARYQQLPEWEQNMLLAAVQRIAELMDAEDVDAAPILQVGELEGAGPPADPLLASV
jgi:DNA-binding MarR family transcriptional regulator